jgi:mono/diheme cytochrome c family protein
MNRSADHRVRGLAALLAFGLTAACAAPPGPGNVAGSVSVVFVPTGAVASPGLPHGAPTREQVLLGRRMVITGDCGACHGGGHPEADGWLAGNPRGAYEYAPYRAWAANLTPDPETGLGRYTGRQVFNALRFGLRPAATPDAEITSATPGIGNHPTAPDYLSPLMPWASWRHKSDAELWAIVAYLRHGVRPVRNEVPTAESPPDRWASQSSAERIGPLPVRPFPTVNEQLRDGADREQVLIGRRLVMGLACGECHGGRGNPAAEGWLTGVMDADRRPHPTPFEGRFAIGPFGTYPRNLTPDNLTGLRRFSERQIFNVLRYGLRPGETADVEITAAAPGEVSHPLHPKLLAPPMPWPAYRHLADDEIRAIAAYLKYGLRPVRNRVPDSEGPPDFWAELYTPHEVGPFPVAEFPTSREREPSQGGRVGSQSEGA